jgi:hypothetical protein
MKIKDKIKYELNIFTGDFDVITEFNTNRIVTSQYNALGLKRSTYDVSTNTWVDDGESVVVCDNNGNVVTNR